MIKAVVDASVAVKWFVDEPGTEKALALRARTQLIAPDIVLGECANTFWKKVRRNDMPAAAAIAAARVIIGSDIEIVSARLYLAEATRMAIEFDHPAYDCLYLAVALDRRCPFITADEKLVRKFDRYEDTIIPLSALAA